jgi:NAD(P)-dependent dehydrogenase (short-subunit alcohol dehydrogenase family)
MRLKNKVALVTGGGSGIGAATAQLFAREGARVVVSDIAPANVASIVSAIELDGGEAVGFWGDVTDSGDADAMVRKAVSAYGGLNIVVNSAGIGAAGKGPHRKEWDQVMDVNLTGTYLVSWAAVPAMARSGGGSFVHLASIMSLVSIPAGIPQFAGRDSAFSPYNPSKGGVLQLTRNMAVHLADQNIRANCICPGWIETPLIEGSMDDPQLLAAIIKKHPIGRLGRPEEVAAAALFLASDESSFVTGSPLMVDGGYTAQ